MILPRIHFRRNGDVKPEETPPISVPVRSRHPNRARCLLRGLLFLGAAFFFLLGSLFRGSLLSSLAFFLLLFGLGFLRVALLFL
jgi:hypothetical protein